MASKYCLFVSASKSAIQLIRWWRAYGRGAGVDLSNLMTPRPAHAARGVVICDRVAVGDRPRRGCDRVASASNEIARAGAARQNIAPTPLWVLPGSRAYTGAEGVRSASVRNFLTSFCFSLGFGR